MRVNTGKPLSSNGNAGRVSSAESKEKLVGCLCQEIKNSLRIGLINPFFWLNKNNINK